MNWFRAVLLTAIEVGCLWLAMELYHILPGWAWFVGTITIIITYIDGYARLSDNK